MSMEREGREVQPFPATTALGALARHLTESDPRHFQPANINYGLFEELPGRIRKAERRAAYVERAQAELAAWAESYFPIKGVLACGA
jgi:methylenetetrahydrofolate--tRNA-(uracil-5-)-methyltransferase